MDNKELIPDAYLECKLKKSEAQELSRKDRAFIKKAKKVVGANIDKPEFKIKVFCRAMRISRTQLHNKLKRLTGCSASLFIRFIRLQKAKALLTETDLKIADVAYHVGFSDPFYFSKVKNRTIVLIFGTIVQVFLIATT